jgi:hypothetical protein
MKKTGIDIIGATIATIAVTANKGKASIIPLRAWGPVGAFMGKPAKIGYFMRVTRP